MKAGAVQRGRVFLPALLDEDGNAAATYLRTRFATRKEATAFARRHLRNQKAQERGRAIATAIGRIGR